MSNPVTGPIIASSVLASLTLPLFIFRLWIRIRIRRVGWEDIWASLAFVCGMMNVLSDWVFVIQLGGEPSTISMWIYAFTFIGLVWSVRISIIFSIIRIIPARERLRTYGLMIVAFFLLLCFASLAQEAIQCVQAYRAFQAANSTESYFVCSLPTPSKISQLAVCCIGDAVSVVFPLYVLRTVTLQSRVHRLLRLLFSSSLGVSITCTLRVVCQLVPALTNWSIVISNFQVAICLITCNLLVVTTYLYRVLGHWDHETSITTEQDSAAEKDSPTTRSSKPQQMSLTTIEYPFSTQSGNSAPVASDETQAVPKPVSVTDSSC